MSAVETFHFIRPAWLLLLAPAAWVTWGILRRLDPLSSWQAVISPQLLRHLVVRRERRQGRLRPALVLAGAWLIGTIALAGPTWKKEPTPLTEDLAALFIVLKVTPEMLAEDIQPNRLQRSAQKISDLLTLRPGTRTGLIAYAGSAHLVMPLTSDAEVIRYFAGELDPTVMPVTGDDPVPAIRMANRRLREAGLAGSILLVADYVAPDQAAAQERLHDDGGADVHVLAVAAGSEVVPPPGSPPAPALDRAAMERVAQAAGGSLVLVSPDNSDITRLDAHIDRSIAAAPLVEGERWADMGYWLVPLVALLALVFFRPGGAVALQR